MKISEVINDLQELMTHHGDVNVVVNGTTLISDRIMYFEEIDAVEITDVVW